MAYFASFLDKQNLITMDSWHRKSKVVIIMGQTGSGKTKLSIDLATRFPAEIINSDKMQVYKGLDIVTNKVSVEEQCDIPHHLLGVVDPNEEFTASDFRRSAMLALESIVEKNLLPIIVGGSNSFIEALVDDEECEFRSNFDCCFIWVDVALPLLTSFLCKRVDEMVKIGLVDEVRNIFEPNNADYTRGIRRAIGVSEMDKYLQTEGMVDKETSAVLLDEAIDEIKMNTCKLASKQVDKIFRLQFLRGWNVHRIDVTDVFRRDGREAVEAWERLVLEPSTLLVAQFLYNDEAEEQSMARDVVPANATGLANMNIGFAVAAATH